MARHVVAAADDIPTGGRKLVVVRGRRIVIFNIRGAFFGIFDRCPHQGGSLLEGILTGLLQSGLPGAYLHSRAGEILRCPWHGWEFDVRTGQSMCNPVGVRTRAYDVDVLTGAVVAEGPYVAETVTVAVEQDYLVVDI